MPVDGIFTVYDPNNNPLATRQFTLAPGGQTGSQTCRYSNSSDLNLPRNIAGYAIFTHNGPPGAILPDAYMLNSTATVVVYAKFEGRAVQ